MNQYHSNHDRFHQVEWLLEKRLPSKGQESDPYEPYYGDVTELNTNRLILDSVGKDTLKEIAEDAIDLLGTSVSIYEINGDYAFGMFSSGWCQLMDTASQKLCHTDDNRSALDCGRWLCHENCWNDSAKKAIELGHSTDIECVGGINMYAEPIYADETLVGVINIGYGTPPTKLDQLKELADLFEVDLQKLKEQANSYNPRPKFLLDLAKKRLKTSAKIIGEIVQKSILQKSLVQSEERLRSIIDRSPFPIGIANTADEEIAYWSQGAIDKFGHTPKNVSEWYALAYPDPDYRKDVIKRWKPFLKKASESKEAVNTGEYQVVCKDGTIKTCELYAQIIPGNLIVTFNDITKRKKAEEALLQKHEMFERTEAIANVGSWEWDIQSDHVQWSDELFRIFGRDPSSGAPTYAEHPEIYVAEDMQRLHEAVKVCVNQGKPYELELRSIRTDGEIRHCIGRGRAQRDESGKVFRLVGSHQDITQRKNAINALRKSHERFLTVLNSIDATIYVADMQNYEVLFMNKYMMNTFGGDMTGEVCWEAFRGESGKCSYCHNDQLIDENGKPTGVYTWQDQNPITGKWYNNYDRAIEWTDGRLVKIQIATDITEMKNMEEQLRQAHKMESIGTLAGGIAHEFNNVLAIIMGNNELITEELPQYSLARESAEEIRIAGLRARDVVKQLLTFSRQDGSVKKIMDFKLVVQESMKLIRSTTPTNIKIEQILSADTYPVLGNETQISQLLINLCNNAVDAMSEKDGTITIELLNDIIDKPQANHRTELTPGQYAKLTVSDNGIGMDKETLDRVFEPFFTTKDVDKGSGIGMAVVHGIVEKHGGAIIVDSKPGQGTAFTMFFPTYEGQLEQVADNQNDLPIGEECILYVDDESSIAHLGKRRLESLGYRTESTTDPLKALEMVKTDPHRFDLVITDMAMPNMTGDQLIVEILKIRQDMPTIICTGYSAKFSEIEAKKMGISSFAMKPLAKSDLATIVWKVLDAAKTSNLEKP